MNIKQIKALADILNQSGLTLIEVSEGETRIRLEKSAPAVPAHAYAEERPAALAPEVNKEPFQNVNSSVDFNDMYEVRSPMVGVFYSAPSPDAKPFVQLGSKVSKGDTLCIIEAMKLMNDLVADRDGEIIDICAHNGEIIEFGQTLFKIY